MFGRLTFQLTLMALSFGVMACVGLAVFRDECISFFLGPGGDGAGAGDGALAGDGAGDGALAARQLLLSCWTLFCGMQVTNSVVFLYDGLLLAGQQYAFIRNVFLVGTFFLFVPLLAFAWVGVGSLWALWTAKAVLNVWRAGTSVLRVGSLASTRMALKCCSLSCLSCCGGGGYLRAGRRISGVALPDSPGL
jgi:hypothetical protein